ncbi:glycoside hydrolase superfamily [Gloeopeniophorella convolvens]|nr:glycoside hydrolase superfamily [Gloeopeniophorella convolvens]
MASQIETCQKNGKIVTLSLGGADAKPGFSSDSQAEAFADQIWNSFLGGSSGPRPFGNAVLDGVDLDIEEGAPTGYAAFVNQIRSHAKGSTKRFYITAAPQCPFPDANIGQALNDASFDAVYVQFYNNYCGLDQPKEYNFATWDHWAKTTSANKDIKVYIGAPASKDAAGTGYVDAGTLADYGKQAQDTWSSFGGVMLWDVSLAVANNNFHEAIKSSLSKGAPPRTSNPPSPDPAPRPPPTGSPAPSEPKSKTTSASETATSTKSAVPVKVTVPTRVGKNIVIEVPRVDSRFFRF